MGRTKKNIEPAAPEINETEENKVSSVSTGGLSYSGSVSYTITKNGVVLERSKTHNTGKGPLFNFIAQCIAGNFITATNLRPYKVKLFNKTGEIYTDLTYNFMRLDKAPKIIPSEGYCIAKLSFNIPFSGLKTGTVNNIRLYSYAETSSGNPCAEIDIADPIEISSNGTNVNLNLEWSMFIQNS